MRVCVLHGPDDNGLILLKFTHTIERLPLFCCDGLLVAIVECLLFVKNFTLVLKTSPDIVSDVEDMWCQTLGQVLFDVSAQKERS